MPGRYEEAERYLEQAAGFCEKNAARFFEARTELAWGSTLAARGQPDDLVVARRRLEPARSLAASRGYKKVETRAIRALESLAVYGVAVPPRHVIGDKERVSRIDLAQTAAAG